MAIPSYVPTAGRAFIAYAKNTNDENGHSHCSQKKHETVKHKSNSSTHCRKAQR
jgi:hypothetical protein